MRIALVSVLIVLAVLSPSLDDPAHWMDGIHQAEAQTTQSASLSTVPERTSFFGISPTQVAVMGGLLLIMIGVVLTVHRAHRRPQGRAPYKTTRVSDGGVVDIGRPDTSPPDPPRRPSGSGPVPPWGKIG